MLYEFSVLHSILSSGGTCLPEKYAKCVTFSHFLQYIYKNRQKTDNDKNPTRNTNL